MKAKEVKTGEIFVIDNTYTRPKLKLEKGYVDLLSGYVWVCRLEVPAEVLTESGLMKVRIKWKITEGNFNKYVEAVRRKHIK